MCLANIVGAQITDATDAQAKLATVRDVFTSTNAAAPQTNFEATFFNGTPLLDGAGDPSPG
jgi:flagellar hook-associated protein 3 FlgL